MDIHIFNQIWFDFYLTYYEIDLVAWPTSQIELKLEEPPGHYSTFYTCSSNITAFWIGNLHFWLLDNHSGLLSWVYWITLAHTSLEWIFS